MRYLKWENDVVGIINDDNSVHFTQPDYNDVLKIYTKGATDWTPSQFSDFLSERVVSKDRRDIEKILFRCGLSTYDVLRIADITHGINSKDLFWIADTEDEPFDDAMTDVFASVFKQKIDRVGDSIDTPEGYNIKRYGVYKGKYGIFKQRINPLATDVESEVAVYLLGKRLGVPCCPAYKVDENTVFSEFLYDFSREYIVHFRRLFDGPRSENEYENLISIRPQYKHDIQRMILMDFITRQDDRHLSNIAVKISKHTESFYPLYDNGRSLFYEDTEGTVEKAAHHIEEYATSFGYTGTYWDYVREIVLSEPAAKDLIDLQVTETEISDIIKQSGIKGYRYDGSIAWIHGALKLIKEL